MAFVPRFLFPRLLFPRFLVPFLRFLLVPALFHALAILSALNCLFGVLAFAGPFSILLFFPLLFFSSWVRTSSRGLFLLAL